MANLSLNPNNLPAEVSMAVNADLYITVAASCAWCYSDPDGVFPAQGNSGCLPAQGSYTLQNPPRVFVAAVPKKSGTVYFNAVASGNCSCGPLAGHTIHVS